MNDRIVIAAATAFGAGLMYWLDPSAGRRRRARAVEKAIHWRQAGVHEVDMTVRDVGHRLYGRALEARARLKREPVASGVLVQRVRARIGRLVSHPGAICVTAADGYVTLSGAVLADEVTRLISAVRAVRGVREVLSDLQVHETPSSVPSLQAGGPSEAQVAERVSCASWPKAARGGAATIGAGMAILGRRAANPMVKGAALLAGGALITRALTDVPLSRLVGLRSGRRAVVIDKSITINQSVEQVFNCFRDVTGFPHFMSHVRAVEVVDDKHHRWVVDGPAGIPIRWKSEVTRMEPNRLVAWRSVPGSLVESAGKVVFTPVGDGSTRIEIQMSYNPVVGLLGHFVARLFGVDPKSLFDDDLVRMKTYLETGKAPRDAAERTSHLYGRRSHLVH